MLVPVKLFLRFRNFQQHCRIVSMICLVLIWSGLFFLLFILLQLVTFAICRLGKLNIKWDNLSYDLQTTIVTQLNAHLPTLTDRQVSNILFGLGRMETSYPNLPVSLQDTICAALIRCGGGRESASTDAGVVAEDNLEVEEDEEECRELQIAMILHA